MDKTYGLISAKLEHWLDSFVVLLPNIVLAALVLAIGLILAKVLKRLFAQLLHRYSKNRSVNRLFLSFFYVALIGIIVFSALTILKLDKAVTTILAGAGILGLALAFAFQDIAANFISGIFISFRQPIRIGNIVKIKDFMGKIEDINLRDTVIRTFQGQMVIIPNKEVFQNPIENYSLLGKRRFDITIGISYGDDLEKVKQITLKAVSDLEGLSPDDAPSFFYNEFGESSINFTLRLWVKNPEQPEYLNVGSNAIMKIKAAYDANDIMIPFPIRTLDFGIKGGVPLQEAFRKNEPLEAKGI
ncbi:MAG: mechanosensitive ion channel [Chitinophagaceae bacterium]